VTKPELEAIRGVNADYVLRTLLERNLVAIVGRAATPGRPLLYGTTRDFLRHFGLNDLAELPKPREIDELLAEAQFEVEKRMLQELEEKREKEEGPDDEGLRLIEGGE
jgi:segregation and condensation protein B